MKNSNASEKFLCLKILTIPGSSKNNIKIRGDDTSVIHISAPPMKGKANEKLITLISNWLELNKKEIEIIKGENSREKLIKLSTQHKKTLETKIEELKKK
ncbi:MAG: DUF167 domain-containing protein [Candidatus Hydrogenedentes bacterium]|nr:DUF167 domain-containing protein [Candidatus Hydrogenedentota bacterium]